MIKMTFKRLKIICSHRNLTQVILCAQFDLLNDWNQSPNIYFSSLVSDSGLGLGSNIKKKKKVGKRMSLAI